MVRTAAAQCPSCDAIVEVEAPEKGRQVECPDCESMLMVISLEPLRLDYALDADEDGFYPDDEPSSL